jgi:hypothetical protein
MPPHCDSLDGPVVAAARHALHEQDVNLALPYVDVGDEDEVRQAFTRVLPLRELGADAAALAEQWFFETVVRLHRKAEHAPYTGLTPAGQDVGPAVPLAEKAVETGDVEAVYGLLASELREQLGWRVRRVGMLAAEAHESVALARAYTRSVLGFQIYAHKVYQAIRADELAHG